MKKFNEKLGGNTLEVTNVSDADHPGKNSIAFGCQRFALYLFDLQQSDEVLENVITKLQKRELGEYMPDVYNLALKNFANNGYSKDSMFSRMKVICKFAGFGAEYQISLIPDAMIVRTDVLEQLGKTMPKTIADWDDPEGI